MAGLLRVFVCLTVCVMWTLSKNIRESPRYSNHWVAKIQGGEDTAQRVARDLGFTYMGQCGELEGYYEFIREDHPQVSLRDSDHLTDSLLDLEEVKWAKQQLMVKRTIFERHEDGNINDIESFIGEVDGRYEIPKSHVRGSSFEQSSKFENLVRDSKTGSSGSRTPKSSYDELYQYTEEAQREYFMSFIETEAENQQSFGTGSSCRSLFQCISYYPPKIVSFLQSLGQGDISNLGTISTQPAPSSQLSGYSLTNTKPIKQLSRKISAYLLKHSDPFWLEQWNIQDYRTTDMPVMDLNVVPVHNRGITGQGITVAVVDNGVEHDNFDFGQNFLRHLSYDYCKEMPGSHPDAGQSHGTNCAGVVAMIPDNGQCGVGIAYSAKIVGIKAICADEQLQSTTGKGLIHRLQNVDIYSSSWNPPTRGVHLFERDHLDDFAVEHGATRGRNGKGAVYVQSAGNDKSLGDTCAFKPNVNSPYVIAIGSASQLGTTNDYSEACTAVFATTYSYGNQLEGIVAPSMNGECRNTFSGNSAACSTAAGIIALALSANKELKYRDVMHLITMSAEVAPLADNSYTWYKNGRGFWVSNDFGFGLMNAENMVNLAEKWVRVPEEKRECTCTIKVDEPQELSYGNEVNFRIKVKACKGTQNEVKYLEHIELSPHVEFPFRGDIVIFITSPAGTFSKILQSRSKDSSSNALNGIRIVSVHNWGEEAQGTWLITFSILGLSSHSKKGLVHTFTLTFHGTLEKPAHYSDKGRSYAAFRLPDGKTN